MVSGGREPTPVMPEIHSVVLLRSRPLTVASVIASTSRIFPVVPPPVVPPVVVLRRPVFRHLPTASLMMSFPVPVPMRCITFGKPTTVRTPCHDEVCRSQVLESVYLCFLHFHGRALPRRCPCLLHLGLASSALAPSCLSSSLANHAHCPRAVQTRLWTYSGAFGPLSLTPRCGFCPVACARSWLFLAP